jgi:hypothetical protein
MRTGRALVLIAMLAVQPISVFGDGTVFPPDPIGEKEYRTHIVADTLPLVIIVSGLLLAWLLHRAQRKAKNAAPDNTGSYHS